MEMVILKVNEAINDLNNILYVVQHPAKDKLATFAGFNEGWNLGEGRKFSEEVIKRVSGLIDECLNNNLFEIDIFPGLDGDIRLTIYETPDYYEFTLGDSISYCHERNDIEQNYQEGMPLSEVISQILDIGKNKWTSSESLTHAGSINERTSSRALRSNVAQDYPYLITNAL